MIDDAKHREMYPYCCLFRACISNIRWPASRYCERSLHSALHSRRARLCGDNWTTWRYFSGLKANSLRLRRGCFARVIAIDDVFRCSSARRRRDVTVRRLPRHGAPPTGRQPHHAFTALAIRAPNSSGDDRWRHPPAALPGVLRRRSPRAAVAPLGDHHETNRRHGFRARAPAAQRTARRSRNVLAWRGVNDRRRLRETRAENSRRPPQRHRRRRRRHSVPDASRDRRMRRAAGNPIVRRNAAHSVVAQESSAYVAARAVAGQRWWKQFTASPLASGPLAAELRRLGARWRHRRQRRHRRLPAGTARAGGTGSRPHAVRVGTLMWRLLRHHRDPLALPPWRHRRRQTDRHHQRRRRHSPAGRNDNIRMDTDIHLS